jgi:NAD(P)-dependent dehydrogenase (short-subunit alcohol dehydrogenase family)
MTVENVSMDGKIVLITGGTNGIGKATATGLARMGATVIITGRDQARGAAAIAEIKRASGNDAVDLLLADFASLAQVRQLAATVQSTYDRLDVLINNAGVWQTARTETVDGIETTFAVNHLAPFVLTNLLLPLLRRSAPARIVNVASIGHQYVSLDIDDLQGTRGYNQQHAYNQSKLANVLFTYELARRLDGTGVTANALNPGWVNTNMTHSTGGIAAMINTLARPWQLTPERGALTSIFLTSSPVVDGVTGKYWDHKQRDTRTSNESYNHRIAQRLWRISAELTGLRIDQQPAALEETTQLVLSF